MRFACEGCGKRYATAAPLAPGQVLRITCTACGHLVEAGAPAEPGAQAAPHPPVVVTAIDTEPPLGEGSAPVPLEERTFVELFAEAPSDRGAPAPHRPAGGEGPRRATPAPRTARVPDIPTPRARPRAAPLVFIAAGVLALLAILAFVLLRGTTRPATPTPTPTPTSTPPPPPPATPAAGSTPTPTPTSTPTPTAAAPAPARRPRADARERDRRRAAAAEPASRLTPQQIERVLTSARKAFGRCLAEADRAGEVRLDGRRVVLRLNVQGSGAVTYPTLDDASLNRTELGGCLKRAARQLAFPRFRGGAMRVEVPLVLAAAGR